MAWLKRMDARGYDVLIRPGGVHGLVILDAFASMASVQLWLLTQIESIAKHGLNYPMLRLLSIRKKWQRED